MKATVKCSTYDPATGRYHDPTEVRVPVVYEVQAARHPVLHALFFRGLWAFTAFSTGILSYEKALPDAVVVPLFFGSVFMFFFGWIKDC